MAKIWETQTHKYTSVRTNAHAKKQITNKNLVSNVLVLRTWKMWEKTGIKRAKPTLVNRFKLGLELVTLSDHVEKSLRGLNTRS